jgi:archaellum component FlaC
MDNDLVQLLRSVIREELVPVNERLDRTDERLVGVSQQLGKVDQQLGKVDQQLGNIDQQLDNIDQRLNRIEEDQHLIKSAVLDTNERLVNVEALLENQHRIIELLSARSIEQEAKLKRIK